MVPLPNAVVRKIDPLNVEYARELLRYLLRDH
jgi:hypothetical protein